MPRHTAFVGALVALLLASSGCMEVIPPYQGKDDAGPTGWEPAPWGTEECPVTYAPDPAAVLPERHWIACGNDIAGCVMWDMPRGASEWLQLDSVYQYGARTLFTTRTNATAALYDVDTGAMGAWFGGEAYLSEGGMVLSSGICLFYGNADAVAAGAGSQLALDGTADKRQVAHPLLGVSRMALDAYSDTEGSTVLVEDLAAGRATAIPKANPQLIDTAVAIHNDEVLFARYSNAPVAQHIGLLRTDGSVVTLYENPDVDIAYVVSDGVDVVWQEGPIMSPYYDYELWTSPWADDPAAFHPRHVMRLRDKTRGVYTGGGYYALPGTVVRLSDGAVYDIPPPAGCAWGTPWGIVNGELWALAGCNGTDVTIVRVPVPPAKAGYNPPRSVPAPGANTRCDPDCSSGKW